MVAPLQLDRISVPYGEITAVREVSLDLSPGELHVILGQSGSGKSTLLRAVAGLQPIRSGRILLDGRCVEDPERGVLVPPERRGIGMVFQDYALFPHLSVVENIGFARGRRGRDAALLWLERIGLSDLGERDISALSGGQQQRVALARALAAEPKLLLLDEPFSNVDQARREQLREATLEALRAWGGAALLVTHDVEEAFLLGDRISVMSDALLLQTDTPAALYDSPSTLLTARATGPAYALPVLEEGSNDVLTPLGKATRGSGSGPIAVLRPEAVQAAPPETGVALKVLRRQPLGADTLLTVEATWHPEGAIRLRLRRHADPGTDTLRVQLVGPLALVPEP